MTMPDSTTSAARKPLSTGLTIMAILMLIFGGLGLFSAPFTLISKELGMRTGSAHIQELMWRGPLGVWMMSSLAIGTLLSIWLAVGGFGILKRRAWARRVSLGYAIANLVFTLLGQVMSLLLLYPVLGALIDSSDPVERAGAVGGLAGGIAGGLFAMLLPVALLVILTRPGVKAELDAPS
jgi:hypothetical protein